MKKLCLILCLCMLAVWLLPLYALGEDAAYTYTMSLMSPEDAAPGKAVQSQPIFT